jgi:hypothetical protein
LAVAVNRFGDDDDGRAPRRRLLATLLWLSVACEGINSAREIDEAAALLDEDADAGCDSRQERAQLARLVLLAQAEARLLDGEMDVMSELLEQVVSSGLRTSRGTMNSTATTLLALASALSGHLRRAAMLCDELGELPATMATAHPRGIRSLTLAICSYHADDLAAARAALAEARVNLRPGACRDVVAPALGARIAMSDGDKEAAKRQLAHVVATGCTPLLDVLDDALGLVDLAGRRKCAMRGRGNPQGDVGHPYAVVRMCLTTAVERGGMYDFMDAESAI